MAGAKCLLATPSNFQSSALFDASETTDVEGVTTESTVGSTVTACKKVLCSSSPLDSSEYWLRSDKSLCRVGFLEEQSERACTTICFVNVDRHSGDDCHDDSCIKRLASVSLELPRLVESLAGRQPKENEILLLSGLKPPHPPERTQPTQHAVDVCLVQCARRRHSTQPSSIIFEINKFLIGLQSGKERQRHTRWAGQRVSDDDTNRSVSSIEEDFLTASEHLGEDSEEDFFRSDPDSADVGESAVELLRARQSGLRQRGRGLQRDESDGSEPTLCPSSCSSSSQNSSRTRHSQVATASPSHQPTHQTKESTGHYATNLAESVLQDAFIRLSQDETSFAPEVAVSVSKPSSESESKGVPRARACSFELPKIVIVQSPDNSDDAAEWPESTELDGASGRTSSTQSCDQHKRSGTDAPHNRRKQHHHGSPIHTAKPVEVALACAASVVGTISTPQVTEHLTLDPVDLDEEEYDKEEEEEVEDGQSETDYSFSTAMCGMAQVAGAVAVVDLAEEISCGDTEDPLELYSTSLGLLSAAQATSAITLHASVAEGTTVDGFRASVADVLLQEASAVLTLKQEYRSVAHFLEATHDKIVDGITKTPQRSGMVEESEVDDFVRGISETIFRHALEKTEKRKEMEGQEKDVPDFERYLRESTNSVLFDIFCITARKISDISKCHQKSFAERLEEGNCGASSASRGILSPSRRVPRPSQQGKSSNSSSPQRTRNLSGEQRFAFVTDETREKISGDQRRHNQSTLIAFRDNSNSESEAKLPSCDNSPRHNPSSDRLRSRSQEVKVSTLSPQQSLTSSVGALTALKMDGTGTETRTPITCFAEDLAATVVSMATELAAICLENSSGKQPWFCALKGGGTGVAGEGLESGYLHPCRSVANALRRKEAQNCTSPTSAKKHRPPRLSEIKRKTEEQPELMERLVNRVVDETVGLDPEPTTNSVATDPFALFASEVTARIMNCPELNVIDMSKQGQQGPTSSPSCSSPRSRLQCERWSSRGKASSYESIPEEDADPSGMANMLGPGSRLGPNLSRGSSISKQSSCESITDEFSRFMVNQMETEGRGFDLLLDYYAGKSASNILAAAVQQAATKKNGHLNVRTSSCCLSKQSSTESITEEFYRFMLRNMDRDSKDHYSSARKTKEWSNSLLPPTLRSPFCIRQSSVPDRRSSDSRLTVNSPIKANSFDGFPRNIHGESGLNIFPTNTVSATGLCKSDSCLYQRGQTDQITDMLIHDTWSSSIESLMRKNKIIADASEDSMDLDLPPCESQPGVQHFANRLAADIVESGKSVLGAGQQEASGQNPLRSVPVADRRQGFRQSRPRSGQSWSSLERQESGEGAAIGGPQSRAGPREVPLIHIEPDHKEEMRAQIQQKECIIQSGRERTPTRRASDDIDRDRVAKAPAAPPVGESEEAQRRSLSNSSEDSGSGSWAQVVAPDDDPHEDTSSFTQLSEGNGNSSASSLGLTHVETFSEVSSQRQVTRDDSEKKDALKSPESFENADDLPFSTSVGNSFRELLVLNFDLEADGVDSELRATLQWIAASELGSPTLFFRKSQQHNLTKFQQVVQLVTQKSWRVGDLFKAVVQFCQLQEDPLATTPTTGLFDWLLETY
ncbi:A-kinase anchor protein SPHKAP isoform X2 [Denticeps clupeoides]|uniref:A-kinase anchor protein SPHKAP isoform X2 n=1 Tax=Denticeps clupeoides TaxID=299321 RepID=UPI0010A344DD|nr:A-kinase anchor protein SPHKAP isoform X2 [Denticeps clupeoides]